MKKTLKTNKTAIYRYILKPSKLSLELPINSAILSIAYWKNEICLWVRVPIEETTTNIINFLAIGTGNNVPEEADIFVGTVLIPEDELVFHFYTKK